MIVARATKDVSEMNEETYRRVRVVHVASMNTASYPYPWGGHDEALEETFARAGKGEGARVLDVWAGEGNLAAHFYDAGSEVTCFCQHEEQAQRVRERLPQASVIHGGGAADLGAALRAGEDVVGPLLALHGECAGGAPRFDAVVCGGGLTGGTMEGYVALVEHLFEHMITQKKGVLCIVDTSFESETQRAQYEPDEVSRRALVCEAWVEALVPRRFRVVYTQLYPCIGMYKIKRR